jgi:hypothetical protein
MSRAADVWAEDHRGRLRVTHRGGVPVDDNAGRAITTQPGSVTQQVPLPPCAGQRMTAEERAQRIEAIDQEEAGRREAAVKLYRQLGAATINGVSLDDCLYRIMMEAVNERAKVDYEFLGIDEMLEQGDGGR